MLDFTQMKLEGISIHQVGNKLREEGLQISNDEISFGDGETEAWLMKYFLTPFNDNEVYNFTHPSDLGLNEIYVFVKRLFVSPGLLYPVSVDISKHLYENSTHPKVSGGELCICFFRNCLFDGISTEAVGFFKSENKDVFLKFDSRSNNINIRHENGINVNKLDKGCIVFNLNEENGYRVCITDSNRSNDTQYWKNDFLNIKPASDNYHFTKTFLSITKEFVTKSLPENFEVSKANQIDLLNRSVQYFKSHDAFDKSDFEDEIFNDREMKESFQKFDSSYREENDMELSDTFEISKQAVKKQARIFKSVLKLDKNFHVYIHGNRELIEQGVETDGRKYYKLYFSEES
jgi:hypothetical protein